MEERQDRKPPRIVLWAAACLGGYILAFVSWAAFFPEYMDLGVFVDVGGLLGVVGLLMIAFLLVMLVLGL